MTRAADQDSGSPASAGLPERLRLRIPAATRARLTTFAPVCFVIVCLARNLLETKVFAYRDSYSYFTTMHHIAWYASAMLALMLVTHLVLEVPVVRLTWMLYGSVVLFIPIVFALVTGERLRMEYLKGSPGEVLTHIATFSLTYRRDWPMAVEMAVIFVGMGAVGYLYRRSWLRAVAVAVCTYLTIAVVGLAWFNVARTTAPIFPLDTALRRAQPLLAMAWCHVATGLLLLLLWRAGVFAIGRRAWRRAAVVAVWAWSAWILAVWAFGWFRRPFDIAATALPVVFGAFLVIRFAARDRRAVPVPAVVALALAWLLQALAIGPTTLHQQWRLLRRRQPARPAAVEPISPGPNRSDGRKQVQTRD